MSFLIRKLCFLGIETVFHFTELYEYLALKLLILFLIHPNGGAYGTTSNF